MSLRGGLVMDSSSDLLLPEPPEDAPSDFSSDDVDPETGLKGGVLKPNSLEPAVHLEDLSSEINELTRPDPTQNPDADEFKSRAERGVLDPAFKASTLLDESWEDEHEHLHPDRLAMRGDLPETLVDMLRAQKPLFRNLPDKLFDKSGGSQDAAAQAAYDQMWNETIESMYKQKAREVKRKAEGWYDAYLDLDDADLDVDAEEYAYFDKLLPDHPDFLQGPDRDNDEEFLERSKMLRWLWDRPFIEKQMDLVEVRPRAAPRTSPPCMSWLLALFALSCCLCFGA